MTVRRVRRLNYQNSSASTDDFRRVMEQASGADLQSSFTQWLTRPGVPKLEGTWSYDRDAKRVTVTLSQTIAGDPFRLPIEIGIVPAAGALPRVEKAELTDRAGQFTLAADTEPAAVTLDPNTWLLFEAGPFVRN